MRRKTNHRRHMAQEVELDLAPLLAVMVKLVPVLLVSSAFVQIMTIQSDLPGALKEVIAESENLPTQIRMKTTPDNKIKVSVVSGKGQDTKEIPASANGGFDFEQVHQALLAVKKAHPQVFHINISTANNTSYQDLVRLMDEARKAKEPGVEFPYKDKATNETKTSPWMFPEVLIDSSEAS